MKKNIDINQLMVNPKNYRFDPVENQNEAIDLMLEEKEEEILNLAKHIVDHGLDKAKDSRVLEIKKDLYLVLDGNRRVTAIKCTTDPSLIKSDSLKSKFINLRKGKGKIPNKVNCFVYKDEKDAAEWIKLDHTGKNSGVGQDPWEAAGKERFDWDFGGKLSPAMQAINLFEHETKHGLNKKKLKISTVNRIISNPESRSFLGIEISNGGIVLTSTKREVIERLDKLFNKIIIDDVPVSAVYRTPDAIKFMENLFGSKPKIARTKISISPKGIPKKKSRSKRTFPRSGSRNFLIPASCILQIYESRINNIYHELRSLPLDVGTNAVAVLFRVFLETGLDHYAEKFGFAFGTNFGTKIKLAGKITKITDDLEKRGYKKTQLNNIRSVTRKGNAILSIDYFHEYVHSFKNNPTPIDLIYKWDNLQEFFEILWEEISKKEKRGKK
ncbi:MAG: hypothetical protein HYT72_00325 [Candidatus Aenigmarchaeota archaeon]|nr:hypothetical protein [Candidatus Aenigmarchaeota archaeon]